MGGLMTGGAPLRGRAALELVVPSFDYRKAAEFWQIRNPKPAALVYFVLGGTPAYRTDYLRGVGPESVAAFDEWVTNHVLSPSSPLFREVRSLLAEDPAMRDTGLYHTVLAAVAEGNATRGGIANRIDRKAADISHHLTVLQDAGLLVPEPDAFRRNRSQYRITEPFVRFYHAVMRPRWSQLERIKPGRTAKIWETAQPTFRAQVTGPVFERMCRVWAQDFASDDTFAGEPINVLTGVLRDKRSRTSHEVDVVVFGPDDTLLSIGEVKWGDVMGMAHLERLETIANTLAAEGRRPQVLALYSGAGFVPKLRAAADASGGRIQLVDLERLYRGE